MINNLSKLSWACRRGMLELDVLLGNFLKGAYADLSLEDKALFVRLLEFPDPELFNWLLGSTTPDDPELQKIVQMIRDHSRKLMGPLA